METPNETKADQTCLKKPLPTIWNVPDPLWELVSKVLAVYDPPNIRGRRRIDQRLAFDGVIYHLRTGCQWNHLPREFGDDSSVHRTFARWEGAGILDILWAILLTKCDDLAGVDWQWQSADGCLGKARGVPQSGVGKKGRRSSASAPTRPTAPSLASRRACWSRATAGRSLCPSVVPTRPTPSY